MPTKIVKRGSGSTELLYVRKTKNDPPKSATANIDPLEFIVIPQFVTENND